MATSMMDCDSPPSTPSHPPNPTAPTPSSIFDLETYIARYDPTSETRLQRLLFVARHATDDEVIKLGYGMAERHMKDMGNVRRYREVFGPVGGVGGGGGGGGGSSAGSGSGSGEVVSEAPSPAQPAAESSTTTDHPHPSAYSIPYDANWLSATEQSSHLQLETLEARLSTAQSHLNKEAIRTAYLALGDFHRSRGELKKALWSVMRSRDYCTNNRQSGQVCLMVIELGIDSKNYSQVRDYVTKAEHTSDLLATDPLFPSKLRCASSLVALAEAKYEDSARKLASLSAELTNQFNTVMSSEDIALYGALLGLATLGRNELQSLILNSSMFKGRLELIPPLRDALRHYVRAEYGPCLSLLSTLRADLLLDVHLHPHVDTLYRLIRDRCIVQYFDPYEAVSIAVMGKCFGMSTEEMEKVVAGLIKEGKIRGARVNSLTKTLRARKGSKVEEMRRRETGRRVARLGERFLSETEGMILRLSCLENDLVVQNENKSQNWRGRGDDGAGFMMGHRLGGGRRGRGYDPGAQGHQIMYDMDDSSDEEGVGGVQGGGGAMMMDMDIAHGDAGIVNPEDV